MNDMTPVKLTPEELKEQLNSLLKFDADLPIATRISQYVKLRDKIKRMNDAHKEKVAPFNGALEGLNGIMLDLLNKAETDSATAKGIGTAYKTTTKSATIADASEFRRHVIGAEAWDLADWKANAKAVEEFVEENDGVLPPGVNLRVETRVGVRRG
jgi:hypothetical protein